MSGGGGGGVLPFPNPHAKAMRPMIEAFMKPKKDEAKFLVFFKIDKELPLVGPGD